jgi:Flp pilus assembly protein TadD
MRSISTPAALIVIILAGAATLGRVAKFDFTSWDDYETVAHNPQLRPPTARSIASFWTEPQMDLYVPLTYTVWAIAANGALDPPTGELDPRVFHTLNLALHLTAGCITFLLIRDLLNAPVAALIGALLFVVHPLQVESVAWVSGMKDVLFGLLSLTAIWQYVRLVRDEVHGSLVPTGEWWGRYLAAIAMLMLAMLAKPTAMVVPAVVIVLDRFVIGRSWKRAIVWTWPWLVLALACAIAAKRFQPAPDATAVAPALWLRPLVAGDALAFYVRKLVAPVVLGLDYGRTPQRIFDTGRAYWTWLIPAGVAIVLVLKRQHVRVVAAGAMVFAIVLSPLLGLVPFDFQGYSTVADHYMYLAMLGPVLAVAWVVAQNQTSRTIAIAAVVLVLLAARSFDQTTYWRNSDTLFARALQVNPTSYASYNSLAAADIDRQQFARAVELSERAIALAPNWFPGHLTYANALIRMGRPDEAIRAYRRVLDLRPEHPPALDNLAALLAERGRLDQAIPLARRAVELDPASVNARLNLGRMYFQLQDFRSARGEFEAVLKLDPDNPVARDLLTRMP